MSEYQLDIKEFLYKSRTLPVIDVRSPSEFGHGHIPGAVNLPLFTNEERSVIGTLYLQKGSSEAMKKGLELIGPKLKEFGEIAMRIAPGGEALLHCWRGGMRSNSMAWLFNTIGIKSITLIGGYKSYRRVVQESFTQPLMLIVIGGMTGSGKTGVLESLESFGQQVIHLERLARHKGSVFGGIGMSSQPTTEQFENDLFTCIEQLNSRDPIFVEDESLAIGQVFLPKSFYEQMSGARFMNLLVPVNRRIHQLVNAYTGGEKELLIDGVKRLERRLGSETAARVIGNIRNDEMTKAVELVLHYYDKVYARSMTMHNRKEVIEIEVAEENLEAMAEMVINLMYK